MADWNSEDFDEQLVSEMADKLKGEIDVDDYTDGDNRDDDALKEAIKTVVEDRFWDEVGDIIDNECIYYSTCFEIVQDLQYVSGWNDDTDFGPYDGITSVAWAALWYYIQDNDYVDDIVDTIFDKLT